MKIEITKFTNIKLSLRALRQAILNQINISKNYLYLASDIQESKDFVNNLEKVLINMDNLFGCLLDDTEMLCIIKTN